MIKKRIYAGLYSIRNEAGEIVAFIKADTCSIMGKGWSVKNLNEEVIIFKRTLAEAFDAFVEASAKVVEVTAETPDMTAEAAELEVINKYREEAVKAIEEGDENRAGYYRNLIFKIRFDDNRTFDTATAAHDAIVEIEAIGDRHNIDVTGLSSLANACDHASKIGDENNLMEWLAHLEKMGWGNIAEMILDSHMAALIADEHRAA